MSSLILVTLQSLAESFSASLISLTSFERSALLYSSLNDLPLAGRSATLTPGKF
jgi:hypothetical protein